MRNYNLYFILLVFSITTFGCQEEKLSHDDKEILANNFALQILSLSPSLDHHENGALLTSTINTIVKDVRTNFKIDTSKDELIKLAEDIVNNKESNKLKHDSKKLSEFIQANYKDFSTGKMSIIQEYNFANKIFQFHYWKEWKCDLGVHFNLVNHSLDTMILFEFREYEIPIAINNGENNQNPYSIVSNSLQKNGENKI